MTTSDNHVHEPAIEITYTQVDFDGVEQEIVSAQCLTCGWWYEKNRRTLTASSAVSHETLAGRLTA